MARFNIPVSPTLLETLPAEIARLSKEQIEAMRSATFVGMTEGETQVYDQRRARIGELVKELADTASWRRAWLRSEKNSEERLRK
jgi:hypothetical protein